MEEFNETKNLQGTPPMQPDDTAQEQSGNSNECTYWETQTYETKDESFYSYYKQQMNDVNPSSRNDEQPAFCQPDSMPYEHQTATYCQKPKRKLFKRIVAAAVAILVVFSGTATAYANRSSLINSYAQLTKTPLQYYAFVEKKNISNTVKEIKPYLELASQDTAYNLKSDVTLNRKTIDSLLQTAANMSLSDLEKQIGIPVKSFGVNVNVGKKDNIINEVIAARFNQIDVISMELFMDTAASDIFFRFPELSKAYLKFTEKDLNSGDTLGVNSGTTLGMLEYPDADKTIDFLQRYSNIIIDNISKLTLEKNYKLSLDKLSVKCSKMTITITNNDLNKISKAILKEAKNDEYLINLVTNYGMTKEEFQSSIDESLKELNTSTQNLIAKNINMVVYVDKNSNIIGREIKESNSKAVFAYTLLSKSSYNEYNILIKDEDGNKVVNATGHQTKKDGAYDGKATLKLSDPSETYFTDMSFDIEYADYKSEIKDGRNYQYGTFTISSPELMGMQINSESTVKDGIQRNTTVLRMGASTLATIKSYIQYLSDYEAKMPAQDAEVYSTDQTESYYNTINTEKFIKELSAKLGVDLQSLLAKYGK
jgi:hypothetical protein